MDARAPRRSTASRRLRRRRWLFWLCVAALGVSTLVGGAGLAAFAAAPSARSAPQKVAAILAAHGAPSDHGVVPSRIAEAVLATEDSRFYSDPAIDPLGTVRALWGVVTGNPDEGGATIEVQLAKLLYTPGRSDPPALAEQVAVAFELDHDFTKHQILAMYLDAAYFGDGAYGITAAAERYFGLEPAQLDWAQASLLAGLLQAPSAYDPHRHLSAALARRAHVLGRLVAVGDLTPAQVSRIEAEPLDPATPFSG